MCADPVPDQAGRDIRWGYNCDGCETRMNAGQAERMAEGVADGEPLLCGSCRDEDRSANIISDLRAERDRLRAERDALGQELMNAAQARDLQERFYEAAMNWFDADEWTRFEESPEFTALNDEFKAARCVGSDERSHGGPDGQ